MKCANTLQKTDKTAIVEPVPDCSLYIERRFQRRFRFGCEAEGDLLAIVAADRDDLEPYLRNRNVVKCSDLEDDHTGSGDFAFAILDTHRREDRDFARLCETFSARDVFWLEKNGRSFVAKREKIRILGENDLISRTERVKIIVGEPGSGKTTLLKRLLQRFWNDGPDLQIGIGIDLGALGNELEALRAKTVNNKSFNLAESGSLDIGEIDALFGLSGPVDARHLFLDGMDDVLDDHQPIVVAALKLLRDAGATLWIAVRPSLRPRLEEDLGVASYSLLALSSDEERTFFRRHWFSLVSVDADDAAVDDFVEEYLGVVAALRTDVAHRFVASPLLVRLVVETHQDDFGSSGVAKPRDVLELLDAFLRRKFDAALVSQGHDFSDPARQIGMGDAFRAFRLRLTRLAIRQLRLDGLESLVSDDWECETKLVSDELESATNLLTTSKRFVYRSVAEFLVARLLASSLDERANRDSRRRTVAFLQDRYFDGGLATMRVLLDRLVVRGFPAHEAALDDDLRRLVAVLERNVGAMVQADALGRTALHLAASYCCAGQRHSGDEDGFAARCKSTLHLLCRSWQQIQFHDELGFNAFSYAVGSLDPSIVAFQEMAKMLKGCGEAQSAIASDAMKMLRHVERHWAEPRFGFFGYEDLQDILEGFFGSVEFARFLKDNSGHRDKIAAALRMASSKDLSCAMAENEFNALKEILASGFFDELLADKRISFIGLRDRQSEIVLLDEFRSWFRSAVDDGRLAALTSMLGIMGVDSMKGLWKMPEVQYMPLFRKAVERMELRLVAHLVTVFQDRVEELLSGSGLVACLKRAFNGGRISEFLDVFKMLPDDFKNEVLNVINYIKAFDDALTSKDTTLLDLLSGLFYSEAKIFDMKLKVGVVNVLEYFGTCFQKRDFAMAMPLLKFVNANERQHVWDVMGQRSKFEDLSLEYVSFMSGLFKSKLRPSDLHLMLEFLHNYPTASVKDIDWSFWEHAYCVLYNFEIRKPFPPDIQKCLGEDFVNRVLTNKQSFTSVKHLFNLATDEQKRNICLKNDQEFLKFALTNFPQEIISQRCGNGRYLKGIPEQVADTEEYSSWFSSAIRQHKYEELLKLTTFLSIDSQLKLWKKVDYKEFFRDALQDKEYDFVLNLLKVFKKVPDEDLLAFADAEGHLKSISKESTNKLADILSYLSVERVTKVLTEMDFVKQFQIAVKDKIPLTLNKLFKNYKDFSPLVSAMKTSVEVGECIQYFDHFLKNKDGEALWALLQYISGEEKKGAKKVSKYSTSITNAVGLDVALHYASEKYLQQMFDSLKDYCPALTQGYDLTIWQHMLILLGCISYNEPGQFPSHLKKYFKF